MRLLLVQPPLTPEGPVEPPVGLAALAAWTLNLGHDVEILDLDLAVRSGVRGWMGCLEELERSLHRFKPDVVGVTSMYSNSLYAAAIVRRTRRVRAEIVTLAGGSHFGALPRESLERNADLDFVIQGEGEAAIGAFLDQCAGDRDWPRVPSLAWRDGTRIVINPPGPLIDLAQAPDPWLALEGRLDLNAYVATTPGGAAHRVAYVEAGRGCPFACTFCATAPFWRRRFRVKSPAQIVAEARRLHAVGYDRIVLVHDLPTANTRFVSELCDAFLHSRLPVEWMANSRTDISLDGLLPHMKAAGCWKLFFGVESASSQIQASVDKHLKLAEAYQIVDDLARHGVTATCSFILGFPEETPADASRSVAAGARLKVIGAETVQFHRLRLWPPAPLANAGLPRAFDATSVAIEHPFLAVSEGELAELAGESDFFGGYFPPLSRLGSPEQISHLEMFVHHAVAMAPMTLYLFEQWRPGCLVNAIYSAFDALGPPKREELDWDAGRLLRGWRLLRPYMEWIARSVGIDGWRLSLLNAVLDYEDRRTEFVGEDAAVRPSKVEFICEANVPRLIDAIRNGNSVEPNLNVPIRIRFSVNDTGFAAFVDADAP